MVEVLEKLVCRIYDPEVAKKYNELKDAFQKESDRQVSDTYALHYIIGLAYKKLEEQRGRERATELENEDALGFKTKQQMRKEVET